MGISDYFKRKSQESFNKKIMTFFNTSAGQIELPSTATEVFRSAERKLWYSGMESQEFIRFYNTRFPVDMNRNTNKFYSNTVIQNSDLAFMHYNLAQVITKTMANLIFGKEPTIFVCTGNQSRDKELQTQLDRIFTDNEKMKLLLNAAEMASYSGAVGFKVNIDKDVSKYPIIQCYPKENIEVIKKYDRIIDIVFKDYFPQNNDDDYVLYSIYGRGYIKYKLVKENFNQLRGTTIKREFPLSTLEETADLKDITFYNPDGTSSDIIMGVYLENKNCGKSDYDGCIDDFIAIDETYTNFETFIRSSGIKLYLPEISAEKDIYGNVKRRNVDYSTKITFVPTSNPNNQAIDIKRDVIEIKNTIDGYITAINSIILRAINTAGLSPATIGYDIAGANASGEALNIRERVSLRTRDEKLQRWNEALEKLSKILLLLNSIDNGQMLDMDKISIKINFPEYEKDYTSEQAEIDSLISKYNAGFYSLKDVITEMYPNFTANEVDMKIEELRDEKYKKEFTQESLQINPTENS